MPVVIRNKLIEEVPQSVKARAELERRRRARAQRELRMPEMEKCVASFVYFVIHYVFIYDATLKQWIPFNLWLSQQPVAADLTTYKLIIILKARQLGMTWLVLAYALWLMLFHPAATILLFSLRDAEAMYLLGDERLKGMYKKLPIWMLCRKVKLDGQYEWIIRTETKSDSHHWTLGNESNARAFPTSTGDSYTATIAIVDEADLVPDLKDLMRRVKPTIDGGGQMILLSRSDKTQPESEFKRMYRAAKRKEIGWHSIFLPWHARPSRDAFWYEEKVKEALASDGTLDAVWENYPATDTEALAPRSLDKRIAYQFIKAVFTQGELLEGADIPAINSLKIYARPKKGRRYLIGADPAEGNPNSDPSALQVVDEISGAQVAKLSGLFEIAVFAEHIETVSKYYNGAPVLVERNNHGHAVIALLIEHQKVFVLVSSDNKAGWLDNQRGKVLLYDNLAQVVKTQDCLIFDEKTHDEIASIEGASLSAPKNQHDDDADAYALAQMARLIVPSPSFKPLVSALRPNADYKPR